MQPCAVISKPGSKTQIRETQTTIVTETHAAFNLWHLLRKENTNIKEIDHLQHVILI